VFNKIRSFRLRWLFCDTVLILLDILVNIACAVRIVSQCVLVRKLLLPLKYVRSALEKVYDIGCFICRKG
jgi:hypothetical protein